MKKTIGCLIAGTIMAMCFPLICSATTVYVCTSGGDEDTIQEGIAAASDGETVLVCNGTYAETELSFSGKQLTIMSENGPENCVIDCSNSGRAFTFDDSGQTNETIISGFTIKNGHDDSSGGGIYCYDVYPLIERCKIINCNAGSSSAKSLGKGGGIYIYTEGTNTMKIRHCLIINCTARSEGAGAGQGAAICIENKELGTNNVEITIENCKIGLNGWLPGTGTMHYGAGICAIGQEDLELRIIDCKIYNNGKALYGGGLYSKDTDLYVFNSIFKSNENRTDGEGGAIYISSNNGSNSEIYMSQFIKNEGNTLGGAISIHNFNTNQTPLPTLKLQNNLIVHNTGASAGGLGIYKSDVDVYNCTFTDNDVSNKGGGVYINHNDASLDVTDTILWGDTMGATSVPNVSTKEIYKEKTGQDYPDDSVDHSDIEEGWSSGTHVIDATPLFEPSTPTPSNTPAETASPAPPSSYKYFFLDQNYSLCKNNGHNDANALYIPDPNGTPIYFDKMHTSSDETLDTGVVDMGYHYYSTYTPTCTSTPTCTPTSTPTSTPTCEEGSHHGDVNGNGYITSGDSQLCYQICNGQYTPSTSERCAADCNADDVIYCSNTPPPNDCYDIFLVAMGSGSCADSLGKSSGSEDRHIIPFRFPQIEEQKGRKDFQGNGQLWIEAATGGNKLVYADIYVSTEVPVDALTLNLAFNNAYLEVIDCEPGEIVQNWKQFGCNESSDGMITIGAFTLESGLPPGNGGKLGTVVFTTSGNTSPANGYNFSFPGLYDDIADFNTQ